MADDTKPERSSLRVEPYGESFVIVNGDGERVYYPLTRDAAENALEYRQLQIEAGLKPDWALRGRAINPTTGKPIFTAREERALEAQ
jgi:hypothetical protein